MFTLSVQSTHKVFVAENSKRIKNIFFETRLVDHARGYQGTRDYKYVEAVSKWLTRSNCFECGTDSAQENVLKYPLRGFERVVACTSPEHLTTGHNMLQNPTPHAQLNQQYLIMHPPCC